MLRRGVPFRTDTYVVGDHLVWGATARMLADLFERHGPRGGSRDDVSAPAPIILDCDPGHDDMVAILLAAGSPAIDLRAITTVSGNGALEAVTRNALLTCTHAGIRRRPGRRGLRGAARPAARRSRRTSTASAAMDGADLGEPDVRARPAPRGRPDGRHPATTRPTPSRLVPTGPLTNVALLLRRHPELAPKIKDIVLMGGAVRGGNRQPLAEFNIWADPEAARHRLHLRPAT